MKKEVKSQAALEFLTTYAWAFLAILITIGALYSFGIFNFSKFLPQKCVFPSQFECIDFNFIGDEVRFQLINNIGEPLEVSGIGYIITNDASTPLDCTGSPAAIDPWIEGAIESFIFTGCTGGAFIQNERVEAKITITYCATATSGCPPHTINGKIIAVVNSP